MAEYYAETGITPHIYDDPPHEDFWLCDMVARSYNDSPLNATKYYSEMPMLHLYSYADKAIYNYEQQRRK